MHQLGRRWTCQACAWSSDDPEAAREHFGCHQHNVMIYVMTDEERVDDLLLLREELAR